MALEALSTPRFIRKTQLGPNEYRKNFYQLDSDAVSAVASPEAYRVTPAMSMIYMRLVSAPTNFLEEQGVLRFESEVRKGKRVTAWVRLCELLGVASGTASKALRWMHKVGVIGYFAGKNGVGIRIFINRAASSIGTRAPQTKKILAFIPASSDAAHASTDEAPFNDSFAVLEVSDTDVNSDAPKDGADTETLDKKVTDRSPQPEPREQAPNPSGTGELKAVARHKDGGAQQKKRVLVNEIVARLASELEPCVRAVAAQAAAQAIASEMARTREWFESRALPKAVRVAQHETYNLLRKQGSVDERMRRARTDLEVGRAVDSCQPPVARRLKSEEIRETAENCLALLEAQGKAIDVTLSELSSEGGGWLLPEDAIRVRAAALQMLGGRDKAG